MTGRVADTQAELGIGRDAELVLAFLNTLDVEEGTDALDHEPHWQDWARRNGLARAGELDQARQARDALRATVGDHPLNRDLPLLNSALAVRLQHGVPKLTAGDAVGQVLVACVRLAVLGQWERVKICPADNCNWAFFDHSRNRSRTWCSMQVCGNRTKARIWRERTRARTA